MPAEPCVERSLRAGPPRDIGLAGRIVGFLSGGHRGKEEAGVVAAFLVHRCDPVRERAQQIRAQRQLTGTQEIREGDRLVDERVTIGAQRRRIREVLTRRCEQHPAFLERLADRGAHECLREFDARGELVRPPRRLRAGPGEIGVAVALVDPTAGEHGHPAGEGHLLHPALQEHLDAVVAVAGEHHRRRVAQRCRMGVGGPGIGRCHVSQTSSAGHRPRSRDLRSTLWHAPAVAHGGERSGVRVSRPTVGDDRPHAACDARSTGRPPCPARSADGMPATDSSR